MALHFERRPALRRVRSRFSLTLSICGLVLAACSHATSQPAYDASTLPAGALGAEIRYGRELVMNTRALLPHDVRSRMDCATCHIDGGTQAHGLSFIGTYAAFPQWNARAHRIIALQDRIAECFLYSMNGRPPAYSSREMIAIVAYIAWLSRGTPTLSKPGASQSFKIPLPSATPDVAAGAALYAQRCSTCHGANGAGGVAYPPLWGTGSFNAGAGMAHLDRMTGFVYYNMPKNAPRTLTAREAYDVAAFVLSHERPAFNRNARIATPELPAGYF